MAEVDPAALPDETANDAANDERADCTAINVGSDEALQTLRDRIIEALDAVWTGKETFDAGVAADAVMAVVEDEAINRMAETFVAESRMRALDFRDGMKMDVLAAREIAANWVAAARAMLGDAPNYAETPVEMETGLAGERERFAFTLQRVGKVTPHEARKAAEAERDAARATIAEVQRFRDDLAAGPWTGTARDWVIGRLDAALGTAGGGETR